MNESWPQPFSSWCKQTGNDLLFLQEANLMQILPFSSHPLGL